MDLSEDNISEDSYFGDYIGLETISTEYKVYRPSERYLEQYSKCELTQKITQPKWTEEDNQIVLNSLKEQLNIYIPKYACAFLSPYSNVSNGVLYIGPQDHGIIGAIPFDGNLHSNINIMDFIYKSLDDCLITSNIELIKSCISAEIIQIKYRNQILEKPIPELILYNSALEINQNIDNTNKKIFSDWHIKLSKYATKLCKLCNTQDTRQELREYILLEDSVSPVLEWLDKDNMLEDINHTNILFEKYNKSSPYYWVCRWRDIKTQEILDIKPKIDTSNRVYGFPTPLSILKNVNSMIPYWMQYPENKLNLYVVKIRFDKSKLEQNIDISYINLFGDIIETFRTMNANNEPVCAPIKIIKKSGEIINFL